jgi:exopolysaccharide biosynthesis protein
MSASIQPYSADTFNSGTPDVVGLLSPSASKNSASPVRRTFIGVRNNDGDGTPDMVLLFSSTAATQAAAVDVLSAFAANPVAMLDGGGSTFMILKGTAYIKTLRQVPHAIVIYGGK